MYKTPTQLRVEEDLKDLQRCFERVSQTRETATEFLKEAGILDANGESVYCSQEEPDANGC